jgi:nicotinate-nucleotide adenylyltransferase
LKRYGVLGGAFNPIHLAHLIIAEDVRQQMHLDKVLFIPYANPPHKEASGLENTEHRVNMIKMAIESNIYFEYCDIEIKKDISKKSYTVDTLLQLREKYKNEGVALYLIIGMDNLVELHTWKDPGKLFLLSQVLVLNRPGYLIQDVQNEFDRKATKIPAPDINISSTDIRHRVYENKSIKYLVPDSVEKYIFENKLYKEKSE